MWQNQLTFPINSFERFHCVWETGQQDDDGMLPEEVHSENIIKGQALQLADLTFIYSY